LGKHRMKSIIKTSILGFVAVALAGMPLHAADRPENVEGKANKEEGASKPNKTVPFHGKLASKTDSSITVGSRTFEITADTKIMKDERGATLADVAVGDQVRGSYMKSNDKLVTKSLYIGPKPKPTGQEKKERKDAKKSKKEDGGE